MPRRRHDTRPAAPPTPWVRERRPWVPEPSPTGRTILRMWIEEQLRLVNAARRRRKVGWRRGREAPPPPELP